MLKSRAGRILLAVSAAALLIPSVAVRAGDDGRSDVAAKLEVKVLDVQEPASAAEGSDATFRMEIVSVLRSELRLKPGETIIVRAPAPQKGTPAGFAPGWIGTAYLNPDPKVKGSSAGKHFVVAESGGSFEDLAPAPPSARWIEYVNPDDAAPR